MVIIADNNIYPELIGGEAWWGKICDTLAEWYVRPDIRYEMLSKWEYFIKDAMSYKPLDRTTIKSRDMILANGQTYDEFKDPLKQVAHHLWNDIQSYEIKAGSPCRDFKILSASLPKLV